MSITYSINIKRNSVQKLTQFLCCSTGFGDFQMSHT